MFSFKEQSNPIREKKTTQNIGWNCFFKIVATQGIPSRGMQTQLPSFHSSHCICFPQGCCNKVPQTGGWGGDGGLKTTELIRSQFWSQKSKIKVSAPKTCRGESFLDYSSCWGMLVKRHLHLPVVTRLSLPVGLCPGANPLSL